MAKLSAKMQERLDMWRKNILPVKSVENFRQKITTRRGSKGDKGDVMTLEDLENEHRRSQTRR
jgi:hypothetical protein